MGYSAKAVANYFLTKYRKHGITPLKIQKLVYLAHGWNFAYNDDPLIEDEYAEAWQYGPVFPSLYHEFKHRGRLPIIEPATEINVENLFSEDTNIKFEIPEIPNTDTKTRKFLDKIWEVYGNWSGSQLSELTHRDGTPWKETIQEHGAKTNANIDDKKIYKFYRNRITPKKD